MNNSRLFRALLVAQTLVVLVYTIVTLQAEGATLLQVFGSNIISFTWSGQFNLDFLCYLMLSGWWIMWRNTFSKASIVLGFLAMVLGIVFFAPYLLWCFYHAKGQVVAMLLGRHAIKERGQSV